jgi:hypothetical protein
MPPSEIAMPNYTRRTLRQTLGTRYLSDTRVATTTASRGTAAGTEFVDRVLADPTLSGQQLYDRATILYGANAFRVATYHVGTGVLLSLQQPYANVASGDEYELHQMVSITNKHEALAWALGEMPVRREIAVPSVDGLAHYTLPDVAGSVTILDVLDSSYWADAASTTNRNRGRFDAWEVARTYSGAEIRISPVLGASAQLVVEALIVQTLPADDSGVVAVSDLDTLLWGATAHAYWLLQQDSPGQETGLYERKRQHALRTFNGRLATRRPAIAMKVQLLEPGESF